MDVAIKTKQIKVSEAEAVIMFLNFYKLVFLGTKFTEKVLQIKLEPQTKAKSATIDKIVDNSTEEIKSEKSDSSFIIDTSEISSDNSWNAVPDLGWDGNQVKTEQNDNYFKIKLHAMQCLQTLFKYSNKSF